MTTISILASHQPGLHGRGFRQLKPLVRWRARDDGHSGSLVHYGLAMNVLIVAIG